MRLAFTGSGKGKTSAALGIALRAWGHGLRVLYVGVMKTPFYMGEEVGEYKAMRRLGIDAVYLTDLRSPAALLEYALSQGDSYDVGMLDELLYAVRQDLLEPRHLGDLARLRSHVVVTGGYWEEGFGGYFDLVTRLDNVKHYYQRGVLAIRGLDW